MMHETQWVYLAPTCACWLPKQGRRSCRRTCQQRYAGLCHPPGHCAVAAAAVGSGSLGGLWKGQVEPPRSMGEGRLKSNGQVWPMGMGARRSVFLLPPGWTERLKAREGGTLAPIYSPSFPAFLPLCPHSGFPGISLPING